MGGDLNANVQEVDRRTISSYTPLVGGGLRFVTFFYSRPANFLEVVKGTNVDAKSPLRDYHTTRLNDVGVASNVRRWDSSLASLYPVPPAPRSEPGGM